MAEPIFKKIFSPHWDDLPPVMRRHYANRPYSNDTARAEGLMNISSSFFIRLIAPVLKTTGMLVPYEGTDIPVTVDFQSGQDDHSCAFDRVFYFPGKKPFRFRSRMFPLQGRELVEVMACRLSWRFECFWDGSKVILKHRNYAFYIFGKAVPVPLTFLLGAGNAEETPLDDESFAMTMEIRHPLWGKVFGYDGRFKMTKDISL
jgi:hypothetical protein